MSKLSATLIYTGMVDYWGGDGKRFDDNAGCLFANYDCATTLRGLVDQWVDDFNAGGDCDSMHEDITADDVRAAILAMLSPQGRVDYDNHAYSELAHDFAGDHGLEVGVELEYQVKLADSYLYEELPVAIIMLESENCAECGAWAEHAMNDICEDCADKHGYDLTV